ncbi:hypothetical protein [Clostridium pasteurianum]|uniref:Uncharacterized protein n=1 Tax=Clostridium pasteurianum BC1 TaxID=86416 RepID=R4K9G0_CLOPA|nr:hypothetical protein [Clostridium pasteurianum]AGK98336.1 hypothetical protein Clopa_3551 [Clostridium pasteurianum BC1]
MDEHKCIQEQRIRDLETGMAETRVYVKMIKEDITDIKQSVKEIKALPELQNDANIEACQSIIIELIKLADLSIKILGAIVGAIKLLGK